VAKRTEQFRSAPSDHETQSSRKDRLTILIDSDVVEFFKKLAARSGALPYQTQINAALRQFMENATATEVSDLTSNLRQAKDLIDAALRKISGSKGKRKSL